MRLAIALVIFAICAYIGHTKAKSLKLRSDLLFHLVQDIERLILDMDMTRQPVRAILQSFSPCKLPMFWETLLGYLETSETLCDAWMQTIQTLKASHKAFSRLSDEEIAVVLDFGKAFGKSEMTRQKKNADISAGRILCLAGETAQSYKTKGKAYGALGILLGAAIAILLI